MYCYTECFGSLTKIRDVIVDSVVLKQTEHSTVAPILKFYLNCGMETSNCAEERRSLKVKYI